MKTTSLVSLISGLLILLWVYAAASKLLNYEQSRSEMMDQVFPTAISEILVWAVPISELFIAALLLFNTSRKAGLLASSVLLFAFSMYIILVMNSSFSRIPCSCGGILSKLTWGEHLAFNMACLGLTLVALTLNNRKEVQKD